MPKQTKKQTPAQIPPQNQPWKQWLVVAGGVIGGFILLNLIIWAVYLNRAYPGVKVGSTNLGNASRVAVRAHLGTLTRGYELTIQVKDQEKTVQPEEVDLSYNLEKSTAAAINQGKNSLIPLYGLIEAWQNGAVKLSYSFNEEKLRKVATDLAGPQSVPATDAKVVITGEEVTVEADKPGQGVDVKHLTSLIISNAAIAERRVQVKEQATKAAVTVAKAEKAAEQARKLMALPVQIQVGAKSFSPGKTEIGKWLSFTADTTGNLTISTNKDAVGAYVASVASQVDVAAVTKQINMVNGEVRTINEGKNGSALDKEALVKVLADGITANTAVVATGTMNTLAFKTRTNSTVDLQGKYIEINLSRQHLWAYDNKQLVYDAPITSGATGAGFATIQGLFSVKAKQTNRNLNGYAIGYDYNVFVNYWMPFSGNYGMHDASWRSSFGGSDYYYGGSHGCVNLPAAAAAWVYNFVNVGTPVWVHS